MATDDLITYDKTNKVLMSVPQAFEERPESVVAWNWRPNIDPDKPVKPGAAIADVQWDDNTREPVTAPAICSGTISAINNDILIENLHFAPPQFLLKIA